jgi:two-component sensor histidine kinase
MTDHTSSRSEGGLAPRLRQHQVILLEFARVAAQARDMARLLEIAAEQAARAIGVRHSKVLRYVKERAELVLLAGKGWEVTDTAEMAVLAIDMGAPPGRAFQINAPVLLGNLPADAEFHYHPLLKKHGILSVLNVPVAVNGVVWGVLEVDSTEQDAFSDDDAAFLHTMGFILALAIQHREIEQQKNKAKEEVNARLVQADVMLQEQNHRVRNYFQMIMSLLSLRSLRARSEEQRAEYKEVMERVAAIGLAHDLLMVQGGDSVVEISAYLGALCDNMERSLGEGPKVAREFEMRNLRADRIVPIGLILNELLTNCIKYAAIERPDRMIAVRFSVNAVNQEAKLTVHDNGPGMGERRAGSKGLSFVSMLAEQLSGRMEIESSSAGTRVFVSFPLFD